MSWPTELKKEVLGPFSIHFETNEMPTSNKIYVPYEVNLKKARAVVFKALSATDAGEILVKNAAGTTLATLSFAASTTQGAEQSAEIAQVADCRIKKDSFLQLSWWKTTAGGKAFLTIEAERVIAE